MALLVDIAGAVFSSGAKKKALKRAQAQLDEGKKELITQFGQAQGFFDELGFDTEFFDKATDLGQELVDQARDPSLSPSFTAGLEAARRGGAARGTQASGSQLLKNIFVAQKEQQRRDELKKFGANLFFNRGSAQNQFGLSKAGAQANLATGLGENLANLRVGGANIEIGKGQADAQMFGDIGQAVGGKAFEGLFKKIPGIGGLV